MTSIMNVFNEVRILSLFIMRCNHEPNLTLYGRGKFRSWNELIYVFDHAVANGLTANHYARVASEAVVHQVLESLLRNSTP